MKRTHKSHLELSRSSGIRTENTAARKAGLFVRANTWGGTPTTRKTRRDTKTSLRNYC